MRSPHLQKLFGRFATYIGSSPYLAPATLGVISDVELNEGVWYPEGGIFSIARALYDLACRVGAEVRLTLPGPRIIVAENGRAIGRTICTTARKSSGRGPGQRRRGAGV